MKTTQARARGFTLIEVLVTVLLLSIGLLSLGALQGVSLRSNHQAYLRTQATNVAYQVIDEVRSQRLEIIDLGDATGDQQDHWDELATGMLPGGTVDVDIVGNDITVEVSWIDDRSLADADEARISFVVESRF